MAIEDALADVADTLKYCPVPVIQDALDCAPVLYDKNSGRLSQLIDFDSEEDSADVDLDFAMTRGEARTLVEMCADFAVAGFASDGAGNGIPIPLAVYEEETPKFRDRFPRLYRGLRIAGIAISALSMFGLPFVAGTASADGPEKEGEVHDVSYSAGKDKNSTLDDKIVFSMADGCNWYWIATTSSDTEVGVNMTKVNESMEMGGGIAFDYDKLTGDSCSKKIPYKVTKVYWTKNSTVYRPILDKQTRDKEIEDIKFWDGAKKTGIAIGLGVLAVASGIITLAAASDIPDHLREQRRQRRIKNR